MICPHCQKEQSDATVFCENCGELLIVPEKPATDAPALQEVADLPDEATADTLQEVADLPDEAAADALQEAAHLPDEEAADAAPPQEEPSSKKGMIAALIVVLAVIAAGVVTVCGFMLHWWGEPIAPVVADPADDTLQNITMTMTFSIDDPNGEASGNGTATAKYDLQNERVWIDAAFSLDSFDLENVTATLAHETGGILTPDKLYAIVDTGKPIKYAGITKHDGYTASLYEDYTDVLNEVLSADPATFDLEKLIEDHPDLSMLYDYEDEGYITVNGVEQAIKNLLTCFKDEAWLKDTFGLVKAQDGDRLTVTLDTDAYTVLAAVVSQIDGMLTEEYADAITLDERDAEQLSSITVSLSLTAANDRPETLSFTFSDGNKTLNADVVYSDFNQTTIDLEPLKAAILEANDGFETCRECEEDPAVYGGYCQYCYTDYICRVCGERVDDGSGCCETCFVPCAECGEFADYTGGGQSYCYVCYYDRFCYNDDGNPVFVDGYCESCFVPCAGCGQHHGEDYYNGYCGDCFYDLFCRNDDNPIFKDGYCEDCYTPCTVCGERAGEEYYDGLCEDCYYSNTCLDCGADTDGASYCDDCFTPCASCGEQGYFEEDGNHYCSDCYYEQYCYNDDGNPIYKDIYCEDCFVPCSECGEGSATGAGICLDCYYN